MTFVTERTLPVVKIWTPPSPLNQDPDNLSLHFSSLLLTASFSSQTVPNSTHFYSRNWSVLQGFWFNPNPYLPQDFWSIVRLWDTRNITGV